MYTYDLFHILLSVWHTYESMEYMYVCMYVCVYVCSMYVCMYACMYIRIECSSSLIWICICHISEVGWTLLLYHHSNGVLLPLKLQLMLCLRSLFFWDITLYWWIKEPRHFQKKYIIFNGQNVQEKFFFYTVWKYLDPTAHWQSDKSQKDCGNLKICTINKCVLNYINMLYLSS